MDLQIPRRRALTFSLLMLSNAWLPAVSFAQSDTTEFRASDANGPINQEFDERRAAQAQQLVQWVQQNNPQLWQILVQWEQTTANYKKLSGKHRRFVYDSVFQVEKRSDGEFYYEAPDKGRIDIYAVKVPAGAKSQKLNPQGKPYSLQSDIPEMWICDGHRIAQAKDEGGQKTYQIYNIPPQKQGVNIMDGPLPFLFGLPATQAVQRYQFNVSPETNESLVWLDVLPKREQDQRNWKEAQIILDRKTFLPFAVKLLDPAGTTETVYRFTDLKVNERAIISALFGRGNPFGIEKVMKDKGYTLVKNNVVQGKMQPGNGENPGRATLEPRNEPRPQPGTQPNVANGNRLPQKVMMPNYVNVDWKTARKIFTEKGFQPEFRKAGPAPTPEQVYKVARQIPQAGAELTPGQKVIFYLYEEYKAANKP